ncbi:MAG: carboxylesterase family protein [Duodenibacillus sp.]|nr:carboxylesterase family protein [Duodenibacillus sp.]
MNMKSHCIAAALALAAGAAAAATPSPVVTTEQGRLAGFTKAVLGTETPVEVFFGVPYAAAPTGARRWVSAQPPKAWKGVRSADIAPQPCMQAGKGSEDCLYLNVYRPAGAKPGDKLAVGVYAHGGANVVGSASEHDGSRFAADNGIILVTVQYRMGAWGFLSLPGMDASAGNFGVTDIEAALAWIRRNIGAFGGDGGNVTLMSESAGSTNACRILVDPKAKGLVEGVMLQSEDCVHDVDTPAQAAERAARFVKAAGCEGEADALSCLRKKSPAAIAAASAAVGMWNPVAERSAASDIAAGNWIKVPVLSGSNKEEGRSAGAAFAKYDKAQYEAWVKRLVGADAPRALELYPADKYRGEFALPYVMGDFITDSGMRGLGGCPNLQLADSLGKSGAPAYIYTFEDSAVPSDARFAGYENLASHGLELTYLFPDAEKYRGRAERMTAEQKALARDMRAYWANFVKTKNPNGEGLPAWKPYGAEGSLIALRLNGKSRSMPASYFNDFHKCSFWNSIPMVLDRGDPK